MQEHARLSLTVRLCDFKITPLIIVLDLDACKNQSSVLESDEIALLGITLFCRCEEKPLTKVQDRSISSLQVRHQFRIVTFFHEGGELCYCPALTPKPFSVGLLKTCLLQDNAAFA